ITIVRPDKKVVWVLMPSEKMYMEMPMTGQSGGMMGRPTRGKMYIQKPKTQMKHLGTETVGGYVCDKYEFEEEAQGNQPPKKHYIWISKKLKMPIKMAAADGSFSMEYQDIKMGGVDDSLFEVPPGYQKMVMPFGMPSRR
ncbi:MAG: DUF4412 domain-containing protein, partial [Deltaproteobacteria bacterium]|nr:DUF4412 domain-containing protein [Deltaproteobacteria bacterium]